MEWALGDEEWPLQVGQRRKACLASLLLSSLCQVASSISMSQMLPLPNWGAVRVVPDRSNSGEW